MTVRGLTELQRRFVQEYLLDGIGEAAATRAGASPKSAAVTASKWLKLAKVQEALAEARKAADTRVALRVDLARQKLNEALEFDPAETEDADGNVLPKAKMPLRVRRALGGYSLRPIFFEGVRVGATVDVKYPDPVATALAVLKAAGELTEKVEHTAEPPPISIHIDLGDGKADAKPGGGTPP